MKKFLDILSQKKIFPFILSVTFVAGFFFDILTLPSVTSPFYPFIGLTYALLVGTLLFSSLFSKRISYKKYSRYGASFFFGSLLSYVLVYYGRGGSWVLHYPLFLFLGASLLLHELIQKEEIKIFLEIILYTISLYLLSIFNYPLLVGVVNDSVFILSVYVGAGFSSIILLLSLISPIPKKYKISLTFFTLLFPFLLIFAYKENIIPAVPLTLGESGVYQKVQKQGNNYLVTSFENSESPSPFLFWKKSTFYIKKGDDVFYYAALLTPAPIGGYISHVYEKYNEKEKIWESRARVPYPIAGGREKGYRGYSSKRIDEEGLWRVRVVSNDSRSIGLTEFVIYFK